jgi:hypothetical protein
VPARLRAVKAAVAKGSLVEQTALIVVAAAVFTWGSSQRGWSEPT